METTCDSHLPIEVWAICLTFLRKDEEFHVAQVCRAFYEILRRQRERRGESVWLTPFTLYCTSDERFAYACKHFRGSAPGGEPAALLGPAEACVDAALVQIAPLSVLRAARKAGYLLLNVVCRAAGSGDLDFVIWATEGAPLSRGVDSEASIAAARAGHLHVLEWLRERALACRAAAAPGAAEDDGALDPQILSAAAAGGHLPILKWARENGCRLHWGTCTTAARGGHLTILQWARKEGSFWDEDTCSAAAESGVLAVLKWARENGCPWSGAVCDMAALGGYLDILKWARENDCPWGTFTCQFAAKRGHLEVLQWARENGCPWDRFTCENAAEEGHLDVLKWARENGCPWDAWTCIRAAKRGHLTVLQWARENGCPWNCSTFEAAVGSGCLEVVRWAKQNGCPWHERAVYTACRLDHLDVLKWAIDNLQPIDPLILGYIVGDTSYNLNARMWLWKYLEAQDMSMPWMRPLLSFFHSDRWRDGKCSPLYSP
jgi:hypothetical protein